MKKRQKPEERNPVLTQSGKLTERQQMMYDTINLLWRRNLTAPSVRELMNETGIESPNGVACHLRALAEKGWIDMDRVKARTIVTQEIVSALRG